MRELRTWRITSVVGTTASTSEGRIRWHRASCRAAWRQGSWLISTSMRAMPVMEGVIEQADLAGGGQPAQIQREEHHHQQRQPEHRHRVADEAGGHDGEIRRLPWERAARVPSGMPTSSEMAKAATQRIRVAGK